MPASDAPSSAPSPRAVHDGLFEIDTDGSMRLLGARCAACRQSHFPVSTDCPWCGSTDVQATPLPTAGTLWGHTIVETAPPGYDGPVPFGFGVVELDGGLRVVSRLVLSEATEASFGDPMRLTTDTIGRDDDGTAVVTWAFTHATSTAEHNDHRVNR